MVEILDLDRLVDVERVLKFKTSAGVVEHKQKVLTLGDYKFVRKILRDVQKLENTDSEDTALELLVSAICRMFPSITEEQMYELPISQVWTIFNFTQGLLDKAEEAAPDSEKN